MREDDAGVVWILCACGVEFQKNSTIGGAGNGIDDDYGAKRDAGAITAASIGGQRSTYGRRGLGRCDFVALQVNGNSRDERETEWALVRERERGVMPLAEAPAGASG